MPNKRDIAASAVRANPRLGSRTIARMLMASHPRLWPTQNAVWCCVRAVRGSLGVAHRKRGGTRPDIVRSPEEALAAQNHYDWPTPEPPQSRLIELGWRGLVGLVVADLHSPYFDRDALTCMLDFARAHKPRPNAILYLGDVLDVMECSDFCRDPRARNLPEEIETTTKLFRVMERAIRPEEVVWKMGNHEYRYERYIYQRSPALAGLRISKLQNQFAELVGGYRIIEPYNVLHQRKLLLMHGQPEMRGSNYNPVSPARTALLRTNDCAVVAHSHVSSHQERRSMLGRSERAWSIGCMCDLHPRYNPTASWSHGFGILDTRGDWEFTNFSIVDGKVRPA